MFYRSNKKSWKFRYNEIKNSPELNAISIYFGVYGIILGVSAIGYLTFYVSYAVWFFNQPPGWQAIGFLIAMAYFYIFLPIVIALIAMGLTNSIRQFNLTKKTLGIIGIVANSIAIILFFVAIYYYTNHFSFSLKYQN